MNNVEQPGEAPAIDQGEYQSPTRPTAEPTGSVAVDAVLDSLQDLDRVPIEEHPAIFEQAHRALRAALDDPAPDPEPEG